jgi:hypothetical protein
MSKVGINVTVNKGKVYAKIYQSMLQKKGKYSQDRLGIVFGSFLTCNSIQFENL